MAYAGVLRRWGNGLTRELHRGTDPYELSDPPQYCPRASVNIHEDGRRKVAQKARRPFTKKPQASRKPCDQVGPSVQLSSQPPT